MGLTSQQLTYLQSADQRFQAHVGLFPAYVPTITPPTIVNVTGQPLAPVPMPMVTPRHALVANGASIDLYARDSYNRGVVYVGNANVAWANTGGAGTLTDNGDGTASWTAPANGSGTNIITMTATNSNGSSQAVVYLQYPDTIYDAIVAEIATISADVSQHGWSLTMRVRGDASGFVVGAGILLAITDTWDGTTSTFGGYRYPEGNFYGYITATQQFEDAFGETWLGVECKGPWNILERTKVGETWWGTIGGSGMFSLSTFAPVDAIWEFVTHITDFAKYHNVTLFYDSNAITDLIIEESDLATIFNDVMARTVCTAFCDRYGSLLCIPDPDVRASEWWGTPSPVFDSAGAGPLTQAFVSDYQINYYPYQERKLSMEALDSSKLGMWAYSENTASSLGSVDKYPGKLICDSPTSLAGWVAQVRAKNNRKWDLDVDRHLDHTVDLMNFVDVNFTSVTQTNGQTASGRTWVSNIVYRPDVWGGGWQGRWKLLKCTSGDVDGTSAWGGTGQYWAGVPGFTGSANVSNWSATAGGVSGFCHLFDFVHSGKQGWFNEPNYSGASGGTYVPGVGWSANVAYRFYPSQQATAAEIQIHHIMPLRAVTGFIAWFSGAPSGSGPYVAQLYYQDAPIITNNNPHTGYSALDGGAFSVSAATVAIWLKNANGNTASAAGDILYSAKVCGLGADPFTSATP